MSGESNSEGGWSSGWLIAAVAGVVAAILARWLGDVGMAAAVLVGIFVFLVFGVLLGMFWSTPAAADGHEGHGHEGHAAAPHAAVEPVATPAAPAPAPAPVMAAAPVEPAPVVASSEAAKPVGLAGPRGGSADNLQTIEGIGPALEKLCHELGIYHFDQIASWGVAEVAWMDGNLKGFKGRVSRDKWVRQAKLIGEVGTEAFLIRAKTNDY